MRKRLKVVNFLLMIAVGIFMSGCNGKTQKVNIDNYLQEVSTISIPEGVKIVGMGEATHGNKEFIELKLEVFKTLVKNNGYKVFALEGDFGGCHVVNEYILHGTGSAEEAVKAIGFAVYKTEEMVKLVQWMHEYNASVSESQKLKFYGFDMQRYDNNKNGLLSYIKKVDNEKNSAYESSLLDLNDETVFDQKKDKIQKGLKAIETIISEMEQNKDKYISKSSMGEYNLASQYAICIKENATLRGTSVNYSETRDKYMAEKVRWIFDYEKGNGNNTLFLAGHNGHIEKTSASKAGYTSMGQRLKEVFKDEYYAIATEFYKNTFRVKDSVSGKRKEFSIKNNKSDLMKLFIKSNKEVALLDIKTAAKDEQLNKVLSSKQKMGNVGDEFNGVTKFLSATYTINMVPSNAYNAVIFVRKATPTTMLK
jgi:erythromycin esterase